MCIFVCGWEAVIIVRSMYVRMSPGVLTIDVIKITGMCSISIRDVLMFKGVYMSKHCHGKDPMHM